MGAGVDAVDVAAQVVVVLQAVGAIATPTVRLPTLPVASLHRLPLTATLLPPSRGSNSLQSLAPMLVPAGALLQRPKLEHLLPRDGVPPILPGVLIQLPMAQ